MKMNKMTTSLMCGMILVGGSFPVINAFAAEVKESKVDVIYNNGVQPPLPGEGYSVVIPSHYQVSDEAMTTPVSGKVKLLEGDGTLGDYKGDKIVQVKVSSANGFTFSDGKNKVGLYQLQDETKKQIPEILELSKTKVSSAANLSLLKKAGTKGEFTDTLTFTHSLKPNG